MIPTRQKLIGRDKVEEYDFDEGLFIITRTFINGKQVEETYNMAVARLTREQ